MGIGGIIGALAAARQRWDVVEADRWCVGLSCTLASQGKGEGGQQRLLRLAHVTGGAGRKLGGAVALASLSLLGLS
jgi:hypothetical protein